MTGVPKPETEGERPKDISTKLERIAKLAKQSPQMAFTSLAHYIDIDWLKEAYRRTRKSGAPGIDGQTRQVLENIKAVVEFSGGAMSNIVKTTVYLTSLLDFDMMNEVYAEYFPFRSPARSTVEVAALPKDSLVEIDAIVLLSERQETSM